MKNDEIKINVPPNGIGENALPANREKAGYGSTLAPTPESPTATVHTQPGGAGHFTPANEAFSRHTPAVSTVATVQAESMLPERMPSALDTWNRRNGRRDE
jgi:hypothetical protein